MGTIVPGGIIMDKVKTYDTNLGKPCNLYTVWTKENNQNSNNNNI